MNNISFASDNLKLVAALTAAGFRLQNVQRIEKNGRETIICDVEPEAHGVTANELHAIFENRAPSPVDSIIAKHGIEPSSYCHLAFDAARAAGHNRVAILKSATAGNKLIVREIGEGRTLIYTAGASRDFLEKLINH